jgi:hypothetical protein
MGFLSVKYDLSYMLLFFLRGFFCQYQTLDATNFLYLHIFGFLKRDRGGVFLGSLMFLKHSCARLTTKTLWEDTKAGIYSPLHFQTFEIAILNKSSGRGE